MSGEPGGEHKPVPEWLKKSLEQAAGPNYEAAHTKDAARVNFRGGLMDFLDQAYQSPGATTHMLEGGGPQAGITSIEEYLANVRVTKEEFGERAFALLMNPTDYARLEMLDYELNGSHIWDKSPSERTYFAGLLCQQAMFIAERSYTILDKWGYDALLEQNPEQL